MKNVSFSSPYCKREKSLNNSGFLKNHNPKKFSENFD